jgi:hypothetical protein
MRPKPEAVDSCDFRAGLAFASYVIGFHVMGADIELADLRPCCAASAHDLGARIIDELAKAVHAGGR